MKVKKSKFKSKTLKRVGIWATLWWGVSCAYVLMLVWAGKDNYVTLSARSSSTGFLGDWQSAIASAYRDSDILPALLAVIIIVWIIGGWLWLRELKWAKISYKAAFKDLFLTIR